MKSFQFIFFRLCIYLLAGILAGFYLNLSNSFVYVFSFASLTAFLIFYFRNRKLIFSDAFFGIFTFLFITSIGIWIAHFNQPKHQKSHFLQTKNALLIEGKILEELKPTLFNKRYVLEAKKLYDSANTSKIVQGKILLNMNRDSLLKVDLQPGNLILTPYKTTEIGSPLNPFQFSYKNYLKSLKIERQINLKSSNWKILSPNEIGIMETARKIRSDLILKLTNENFTKNQLAIFQALILGQRNDLDNEVYKNYAAAGAIHILAISGLHIGILLLFLNFILKPLERLTRGKTYKSILIIALLWAFALLTGLSASVVRAVTMFSFLAVGMEMKRKTAPLNGLFLSFFFLLLLNPYYVFQVGFQLSYLAVASILLFQPRIEAIYRPQTKFFQYIWKIISVSLAAQIGVLPLSLYYFHQFPGLFLLTNIIVLPFLGIILIFGLLVIILAAGGILPDILVNLYGFLLNALNTFIYGVAAQETFVWNNIPFSLLESILAYSVLLAILAVLYHKNFKTLILLLGAVILFQIGSFWNTYSMPKQELVIFQKSKASVIGIKSQSNFELFTDSPDSIKNQSIFTDYIRERRIKKYKLENVERLFHLHNKKLLVINSNQLPLLPDFNPELIVLTNTPKINLQRLISQYKPQQIIADGNNYPGIIKKWKKTCTQHNIPFHYTAKDGAFIWNAKTSF